MLSQSVDILAVHRLLDAPSPYIGSALAIFLVTFFYLFRRKEHNLHIPIYGQEDGDAETPKRRWMTDAINLLNEGYAKFQDKPFRVWTTEGYQVVLPPKFIDELKMLPDNIFPSGVIDFFQGKHTTFLAPWKGPFITHVARNQLNRKMTKLFPGVKEELDEAIPVEFPTCHDWTPIQFHPKILQIISRISGRALVGPNLATNKEWITMNVEYTRDAFQAALKMREWHPFLRPVAKYFVPEVRRMWGYNIKATEFVTPIIKQREREEKLEGYEQPNDTLQWIRDVLPEGEKKDYFYQGVAQLAFGAASIHTTSQMTSHIILNLATYPEYIPLLRDEARAVLEESGGVWTVESMGKLKKMDSFMKESQRHSGAVALTFQRNVLKPITLSDGTYLPTGTRILAPSVAISSDPSIYEEPDHFDGLRFYNLRQRSPEDENTYQFVSTSKTQMHFGGGRHACPGRWLASHEIKLILATLISRYDLKLKEGEGRPKNILFQSQLTPNPNAEILFKSV